MVNRLIKLPKNNSFFLFGARGTGKSTLLKEVFSHQKHLWIDLLEDKILEQYLLNPNLLKQEILAMSEKEKLQWVVIDEVQKAPKLLNIVHQLIESDLKIKFALTGSSSRRLKQKGVNLLAGRAFVENLFPLTVSEFQNFFNLNHILKWGALPKLLHLEIDSDKEEYLRAYTLTYIKSEIQEEQWVRNLDPFRKFLPIASQMNGKPLNFSNIAKDVGVSSLTIQSYFEILEDTLLGFFLPAFHRSVRKQQRGAPKFYFFDLGVRRALARQLNIPLVPQTYEYGNIFEHFLICEIYRLNQYYRKDFELSYILTKDNLEIDLVIETPQNKIMLVEIKSSERVDERDTRRLESIQKSLKGSQAFLLSLDLVPKKIGTVLALPWQEGLWELDLQPR